MDIRSSCWRRSSSKPYVKTNKNDMVDAEAICEAVGRPNMRFVPIKNIEQQAILSVHRARQGFVKVRTAQASQIRGLLSEFGIVIPKGIKSIAERMPDILEDGENGLPGAMRKLLERLNGNLKEMDRQVTEWELQIELWHRDNEASRKIEAIPGIGPITASAIVATVGMRPSSRTADSWRYASDWCSNNTPAAANRCCSASASGGDTYLCTLLIHGARAVIRFAENKAEPDGRLRKLMARRNKNVAAIALANKNARIAWVLLAKDRMFLSDYTPAARAAGA